MLRIAKHRPPTTVGEMLSEEFLKPLALTQQQFADATDIDRRVMNAILTGRTALTVAMALRLGRVLGTSPELWLRLQMMNDLYEAERSPEAKEIQKLRPLGPAS